MTLHYTPDEFPPPSVLILRMLERLIGVYDVHGLTFQATPTVSGWRYDWRLDEVLLLENKTVEQSLAMLEGVEIGVKLAAIGEELGS